MNYCGVGEAFDNPLSEQLKNYDNCVNQSFFSAQGDYSRNQQGEVKGTSIKDLQNNGTEEEISLPDSFSTDEHNQVIDHDQCINHFVKDFLQNQDNISTGSSLDTNVYKHIKICKYCKNKINEIVNGTQRRQIKPQTEENHEVEKTMFGYNMKELLLIILLPIILIFIFDLLVKIGKRMS